MFGERIGESNWSALKSLDWFWPSEGKGHKFESCWVRHSNPQKSSVSESGEIRDGGHWRREVANGAGRTQQNRLIAATMYPKV
jgi:hypothetical protein